MRECVRVFERLREKKESKKREKRERWWEAEMKCEKTTVKLPKEYRI